jgi:hypothetical protein
MPVESRHLRWRLDDVIGNQGFEQTLEECVHGTVTGWGQAAPAQPHSRTYSPRR